MRSFGRSLSSCWYVNCVARPKGGQRSLRDIAALAVISTNAACRSQRVHQLINVAREVALSKKCTPRAD